MRPWLSPLVLWAACTGNGPAEAPAGGDTCTELRSGTWAVDGACFGMPMTVDLQFDADACTFELSNWSMSHGGMPEGGAVDGADVELYGGDFAGCTGEADDAEISGTCPDDCAWVLAPEA